MQKQKQRGLKGGKKEEAELQRKTLKNKHSRNRKLIISTMVSGTGLGTGDTTVIVTLR